ncbi:uncharacterized protein LOC117661995 isoform X1 [Pantherophis guttatus]|uniref:Uncharacterized protein LOC117661995 isoform X1 n=1 Tax=Pantherophis guttatus TaxID=94885 RepID=A0A6P9B8B0_PANGU|nr:uncharacterized protein LOC117661995 isoform X1 [Pantherophis guttatus]
MDLLFLIFLPFLVCTGGRSKEIPKQHLKEDERINIKLLESLKTLQKYLEELKTTTKKEIISEPEDEPIFGPHYPIINVQEPPMDIPAEGLHDDQLDIPHNMFFQPVPFSDKAQNARNYFGVKESQPKRQREKVLLIISTVNLLLLLMLTGCCIVTVWLHSRNGRMKLFCRKQMASTVPSRNFQKEDINPVSFSSIMNIVDEATSYSDESERALDQGPKLAPSTPHPTIQPPRSRPEQAA